MALTQKQIDAHREHVEWLDECRRWRSEHRKALALLSKVQAAILEQEAALESHTADVQSHEVYLQTCKLADFSPESLDEALLEAEGTDFEEKHARTREAHERLKHHHVDVVKEVEQLLKRCESAM